VCDSRRPENGADSEDVGIPVRVARVLCFYLNLDYDFDIDLNDEDVVRAVAEAVAESHPDTPVADVVADTLKEYTHG
jgi:hypothetical protein